MTIWTISTTTSRVVTTNDPCHWITRQWLPTIPCTVNYRWRPVTRRALVQLVIVSTTGISPPHYLVQWLTVNHFIGLLHSFHFTQMQRKSWNEEYHVPSTMRQWWIEQETNWPWTSKDVIRWLSWRILALVHRITHLQYPIYLCIQKIFGKWLQWHLFISIGSPTAIQF